MTDQPIRHFICKITDNGSIDSAVIDITNGSQLKGILLSYANRPPRILDIDVFDGLRLWVGIGGEWAGVMAYPIPNLPLHLAPQCTAQARQCFANESYEFTNRYVPYEFLATELMPSNEVIEIILYFVLHRDLPNTHMWGEPASLQYRWGPDGTRAEWQARLQEPLLDDGIPF